MLCFCYIHETVNAMGRKTNFRISDNKVKLSFLIFAYSENVIVTHANPHNKTSVEETHNLVET